MDNESFDERIRENLLNYTDVTPAAVGWNQMSFPLAENSGLKKWLWISAMLNLMLLIIIPYLYLKLDGFGDRIDQLESKNPTVDHSAVVKVDTVYQYIVSSVVDTVFIQPSHLPTNEQYDNESFHSLETVTTPMYASIGRMPTRKFEVLTLDGRSPIFVALMQIASSSQNQRKEKKASVDAVKHKLSLSQVAELEKHRFGKSVKWEFGLEMNALNNASSLSYSGFGMGTGAFVNMWVNPFFSIQSGLGGGLDQWKSKDSLTVHNQWNDYGASLPPDAEITKHGYRLASLNIPLLFRYHQPINDKTQWSVAAGMVAQFQIREHSNFKLRVPEQEHEYELNNEHEYHNYEESFNRAEFKWLDASVYGEVAFRKRINQSTMFWSTGLFYKYGLESNSLVSNRQQVGLMFRLSKSQY